MPTRTSTAVHYGPFERIRVEVLHADGGWYPGWLHAWLRTESGWRATVTYHVGAGLQHYLDVPADHVRKYEEDERAEGHETGRAEGSAGEGEEAVTDRSPPD